MFVKPPIYKWFKKLMNVIYGLQTQKVIIILRQYT
jgi:hypothetical protein